ncbi:sugar phosphate isomerase/epimerase family protein [Pantoea osteomyelitidis]|uniref:Sugar phosphate isomerase/epimerase family protein n=1 Tax=Pantoea osteomyelitidis TaxID=3230026 RepID=A0ABW7Q0R2_9GAMM
MNPEIIVVTAAYGQQQVTALGGQRALLPVIQQAGADGVEIRRELLDDAALTSLPELGKAIAAHRLRAFYSVPDALFMADGALNPQLDRYLSEAEQLNARLLKFSLGHYAGDFDSKKLRQALAHQSVKLVVENDQTACGKLAPLTRFFAEFGDAHMSHGMTFDMGNWLWTGEKAEDAAQLLGRYIGYIHVKAAVPHHDSFRAIALDDADDQWRTLLKQLPASVPRGIEFPLEGDDLVAVTRRYVDLLRNC